MLIIILTMTSTVHNCRSALDWEPLYFLQICILKGTLYVIHAGYHSTYTPVLTNQNQKRISWLFSDYRLSGLSGQFLRPKLFKKHYVNRSRRLICKFHVENLQNFHGLEILEVRRVRGANSEASPHSCMKFSSQITQICGISCQILESN
jgi:hypothetical protein